MIRKIIISSLIGLALVGVGWLLNDFLDDNSYEKKYNGLRLVGNNYTHPQALDKAREYDKGGDWVCVNIRDMKIEKALETCNHEVGHEIFAEICEKNMTRCLGVLNESE